MAEQEAKQKPKKNILLIVIGGLVALLAIGAVIALLWPRNEAKAPSGTETDAVRFSQEYTDVPADNLFVYRDADQIIDILKGGTGVVFMGFPSCPWCQAYAPMLNKVAKDAGIEKIYYLNIQEDRANNTPQYQEIVEILRDYLDLDEEGQPRVFVPDVTVIDHGTVVGHDNETSQISGEITPDEYWTDERVADLKEKLRQMIDLLPDEGCSDVCKE